MLEIQILGKDRYNNVVGLNRLMKSLVYVTGGVCYCNNGIAN
jgi:hypothetical protein